MKEVTIYTSRFCGYCTRAKQLLKHKNITFTEIKTDGKQSIRADLAKRTGSRTVPQIWVGDHYVGGCDELFTLERNAKLDSLLSAG